MSLTPKPWLLPRRFKDMATAVRSQIDTLEQRLTAKEAAHPSRQGNCSHASDARITHVEDQILGIKATMKDLLVRPPPAPIVLLRHATVPSAHLAMCSPQHETKIQKYSKAQCLGFCPKYLNT